MLLDRPVQRDSMHGHEVTFLVETARGTLSMHQPFLASGRRICTFAVVAPASPDNGPETPDAQKFLASTAVTKL